MAVFWFDLLRITRRGRLASLRTFYGLVLLLVLVWAYSSWFPERPAGQSVEVHSDYAEKLSRFAEQFAATILLFQLCAGIALAPICAAGAIAEERQRGTFELLLITYMSMYQLVVGKLASRLLQLAGVLLTSVPILALTQFWGGAPAGFMVAGTVVNLITMCSVAALSLFCSALARTVTVAVLGSYVLIGLVFYLLTMLRFARFASPFELYASWFDFGAGQGSRLALWVGTTSGYALFHVPMTVLVVMVAVNSIQQYRSQREPIRVAAKPRRRPSRRWRPDSRLLADVIPPALLRPIPDLRPGSRAFRVFPRPPIGQEPLLWKEIYLGNTPSITELIRSVGLLLIVLQPLTVLALIPSYFFDTKESIVGPHNRPLLAAISSILLMAMTLNTLVYAAGSISSERDSGTLVPLLTLPGGRGAVLRLKWLGTLLRVRWMAAAVVVSWLLCFLLQAVHPAGAPLQALAVAVHLIFAASLGLCASVFARSTGRAIMAAISVFACVSLLPLAIRPAYLARPVALPATMLPLVEETINYLSPPFLWWQLMNTERAFAQLLKQGIVHAVLLNLILFLAASAILLVFAFWRFRQDGVEGHSSLGRPSS